MKRRVRIPLVVLGIGLAAAAVATVWRFVPAWRSAPSIPPPKASIASQHGPVRAVAFSPDGRHLAAATGASVLVLDRETWLMVRSLKGSTADVLSLAYSPDGTMLAAGSRDGHLVVWDAVRWEPRLTLQEGVTDPTGTFSGVPRAVVAVCFSPDGRTLAAGDCLSAPHLGPGGVVRLFDVATGDRMQTLRGHKAGVMAVAFSPDGARLASADGDGGAKLWDARTGVLRQDLPWRQSPSWVAFDPTGQVIIYGGSWSEEVDVATVWDTSAGSERRVPGAPLNGRTTYVLALALSSDGRTLATGELPKDGSGYRVRLWDVPSGQSVGVIRCVRRINTLAFSPDGGELIAGCEEHGQGEVCIWDVPPKPVASE